MYKIEWSDNYSVGNETIDEQHKKLFQLLSTLQDLQTEDIPSALKELEKYIAYHFKAEEEILETVAYDNITSHKAEHQRFTIKTQDLHQRFLQNSLTIENLFCVVSEWLLHHILKVDREYCSAISDY